MFAINYSAISPGKLTLTVTVLIYTSQDVPLECTYPVSPLHEHTTKVV